MDPIKLFDQLSPITVRLLFLAMGLLGSTGIAWIAYRRQSLSRWGALATIGVGTAIFGLGGSAWWILLIAFFVSSSGLSRLGRAQKTSLAEKFAKGARRDMGQVLANGGVGAALSIIHGIAPWPWLWVAFAGSLAAANADTWATELGVLSRSRPRLVTTGQPVPPGTNGAISLAGTGASLAGALFIGILAAAFTRFNTGLSAALLVGAAASLGGFSGAFFDSLLGATVQGVYFCERCRQETEHRVHVCGRATRPARGWPWLDNDGVNFLSAVAGMVVAVGFWFLVG